MWVVELGRSRLNGTGFTANYTRRFRSETLARIYYERLMKLHCKGGTGYWDGMLVPTVRLYEED